MKRWIVALPCAPLLAALIGPAASNAQTVKIRNEKVMVFEDRLAPGEVRTLHGDAPSVVVYPGTGKVELTSAAGNPRNMLIRPGQASFEPAQPRSIKNTGTAPLQLVRVVFLGKGSAETWGPAGLPPAYRILIENQYARVYEIKIPAGGSEPQHTHKDRVVVCLSGAELIHTLPDGHKEPSTLKTGEISWRPGVTHIGQNVGKTDLWVIAIEPK
jgi:oxalate decarboxylase/phosphoglucose isomerase-like protein (cupin superfamily)